MITENKTEELRLQFFKELYENAKSAYSETFSSLERSMNQYKGSLEIDGSDEKAITTRNITYEIIESQVSSEIPMPKADAFSYSEKRSKNAENIERLCRSIRDKLPFEELNDIDERYTYIYGGSVFYVEWDNSEKVGQEVGCVKVHCLSPKDFIPQPSVYNVSDMEYCFLRFSTTRGEVMRKYGVKEEELDRLECEFQYGENAEESDTVTVIVCYYRDEEGDISNFIFSGEVTLLDIPKFFMRKDLGGDGESLLNVSYEEVYSGDEGQERKKLKIPYYTPKVFPIVIRKNTSGEKSLLGQSDCDYIRPQQQAINKIESRILQKLLRSGITPVVPEDCSITLNNSVFGQVIKMKPGESAAQYGKVDTTPDIAQDIAEAERLYEHAKRIIGISDAFQGNDIKANESGMAKQLRIAQASGRLESKKKMKYTAYAELDKIIFYMYLAFADENRNLTYKDSFGKVHNSAFSRYDFIEFDEESKEYYYDDSYLFSVDLNGGMEYQREVLWQRNLENLSAGTLGSPDSPTTLLRYWQCQERAHYPYARDNVEYFKKMIEDGEGKNEFLRQDEEVIDNTFI